MIVVLIGVSGSGKTTVGRHLAQHLKWTYHEADDFHPPANIEKMRQGIALTDEDRRPWLDAIARQIAQDAAANVSAVVTCSALKRAYRDLLRSAAPGVKIVSLEVPPEVLRQRLASRTGHFFNPALLDSQRRAFEPADDADVRIDAALPVSAVVEQIIETLA